MNADHLNSIWRDLRFLIAASQVALLIVAAGCRSPHNGAQQTAPKLRDVVGWADPTGTAEMTKAVEKAANKATSRLDEFDVEKLNAALEDVHKVMDQISQRLEAVPVGDIQSASGDLVDSIMVVRAQLDRMQLAEAVNSVRELAEGIDAKVKTLDLQRANAVMDEAESLVADIRTEVAKLSESLDRTIDTLGRQLDKAGEKIESLPVQELREDLDALKEAIDSIGKAAESLESSFQRAGTTLLVATVTFVMISLCALAWLVKFVRRRSA